MITLYTFGAGFGLPDISPFVTKVEMLLKLAKLDYETDPNGYSKAPKGKLPFIDDNGEKVADSSFIRWYIEKKYGIDFDEGLSAEQRAIGWAFERMFEDHAYWTVMHARWIKDENFNRGPKVFFSQMPFPQRLIVPLLVRRQLKAQVMGQGMGRHPEKDVVVLGTRTVDAAADFLGTKPFMMGEEPSGLDATAFAFLIGVMSPLFETKLRDAALAHDNIKAYIGRMADRFYPENTEIAKAVS